MPSQSTSSGGKRVFIGTSGWSYAHWKENFFPEKLKTELWLNFYSQALHTVEVNTTFYHLARTTTVENWYKQVSKEFVFSIKASGYITHRKRLKDCERSLELFFNSLKALKSKRGPILFQLPPSFKCNYERLDNFIRLLPPRYKYVFEFRHDSWFVPETYQRLKKHRIALCITDLTGKLTPEEITGPFTYIRLHGPKKAYQGSYGPQRLKTWHAKIKEWSKSVDVYCYFDNDEKGYAIQDALKLKKMLKI